MDRSSHLVSSEIDHSPSSVSSGPFVFASLQWIVRLGSCQIDRSFFFRLMDRLPWFKSIMVTSSILIGHRTKLVSATNCQVSQQLIRTDIERIEKGNRSRIGRIY